MEVSGDNLKYDNDGYIHDLVFTSVVSTLFFDLNCWIQKSVYYHEILWN